MSRQGRAQDTRSLPWAIVCSCLAAETARTTSTTSTCLTLVSYAPYRTLRDADALSLHAESSSWSQAYVAGTSPAARSRHTATLIGTRLFIIAGGDDSRVYNDVYVLDTSAQLISIFSTTDERSVRRTLVTRTDLPPLKYFVSCTS